ncbi:acyl carrier protein [Stenotrophomonas sp. P5_B8]
MDSYEEALLVALRDTLGDGTELDAQTCFAEVGLDSLSGLRFLRKAQDAIGVEIDFEWLFDHPSIAELALFLRTQGGAQDDSSST